MYLPKSKYTVSIAKPGEYTLNGETYVGPVITTYLGEIYAGENIRDTKGTLEKVVSQENIEEYPIVPIKRVPVESEYEAGYMIRYFCQDKRSFKVFEISKEDFEKGTNDPELTFYSFAQNKWYLTGPVAISKNRETIDIMDNVMPGIHSSRVLYNPEQFYRDSVE